MSSNDPGSVVSTAAMHRIWDVPELISMILEPLHPEDLNSVALSCRNLFAPACAIIWSRTSFRQLSQLYMSIKADPAALRAFHDDLPRWEMYTRSVRDISVVPHEREWPNVNDFATMARITRSHEHGRLLPCVTSMSIVILCHRYNDIDEVVSAVAACTSLLSPSLQTLNIEVDPLLPSMEEGTKALSHFFIMLRAGCSSLVNVSIFGLPATRCTALLLECLYDLISHLLLLERLEGGLWICHTRTYQALSRLTSLKTLDIQPEGTEMKALSEEVVIPGSPSVIADGFPRLCSLTISAPLSEIIALLKTLSTLTEIDVTTWRDDVSVSLGRVIGLRFPNLDRMTWQHNNSEKPASERTFRDNLFGLTSCRRLTHIVFDLGYIEDRACIDDSDISQVVRSWPRLRTFSLPYGVTSITFESLTSFARHCPYLEKLVLDFRSMTTSIPVPPRIPSSKQRLFLWLPSSDTLRALDAAVFLYCLWPKVILFDPLVCNSRVDEIEALLKGFRTLAAVEDVRLAGQTIAGTPIQSLIRINSSLCG